MNKLLLLGITGAGKSTAAIPIAKYFGIQIFESDQEVIRLNNGLWPKNLKIILKYMRVVNKMALDMDNIIYITSWLTKSDVKRFYKNGFKIIELHADLETLIKRKVNRDNPPQSQIDQFRKTYGGYYEVVNHLEIKPLITLSLDTTNMPIDSIVESILKIG